ncbi:MAG: PQQ-like beta-propeller repeat protein [Bacteroidales bacterium]|nr:PQQ-like beta-propeller repeat protein [Bacteroidales bacterium]
MILAFLSMLFLFSVSCTAQENKDQSSWPQWMGKSRQGIWHLDLQKESLDSADLVKQWEAPVGTGYSGPTVSGGKVYLMDYAGDHTKYERVLCFDASTGEQLWAHQYECTYSVGYPTGPRTSVLIDNEKAYSLGTMGDLYCLDANSGKVLWHINGAEEYRINIPIWGLASSPLIENDLLIVQLGGTPDACIVAFEKHSGKEVWIALSDKASYSSPIVVDQAGKRVLVCWTGNHLVGMVPESGEVYWKIPYERRKEVINIAMPVVSGPYIFLSSFYDGSMLIKLNETEQAAKLVWKRMGESERKTDALHSIISTPVIQGEYVYGIDSYGEFRCLDLESGDRIWTDSTLVPYGRWSNAHLIQQGDKIWGFNELGELILGKVSPEGFSDLGRVQLIKPVRVSPNPRGGVNWAHPAFSGRRIYARSDALLVCYELKR